jgi:SNF2 family DNA or RNA helicase
MPIIDIGNVELTFDMAAKDKEELKLLAEKLHTLMRPFILRRTKEEVLDDLPKKTEIILYTGSIRLTSQHSLSLSLSR